MFCAKTKNKSNVSLVNNKEIIRDKFLSIHICKLFYELITQILLNFDTYFKKSANVF